MADTITSTTDDDVMLGTSADDTFLASSGNDKIWGGTGGVDALILTGRRSDYTVRDNGNGNYTVTDLRADGDGVNIVRAIDSFQFLDRTVSEAQLLEQSSNIVTGTAATARYWALAATTVSKAVPATTASGAARMAKTWPCSPARRPTIRSSTTATAATR